jgi:death-on-curing protein
LRIEKKPAALFHGVATGHGFVDGNKRTAIFLTYLLLEKSGYTLEPIDPSEKLEDVIDDFAVAVVERKHSFDEIVAWFKARIRKVDP